MSLWTPPPDDSLRRLADLRVSYDAGTLDERDLQPTPLAQFRSWFDDAVAVGLPEPNAMVVATAAPDGQPSARTVLLKDVDARGFVFYTNLGSRKSLELAANPGASCVFPWFAMHRQVVVVGRVEQIGREEAGEYFASRPQGSRLGAWASRQSTVIDGREGIEQRYADLQRDYPEGRRGAAARLLGRLAGAPGVGGVLAGPRVAPARPAAVPGRLGRRAAPGRRDRLGGGAALAMTSDWLRDAICPSSRGR